MLNLSFNIRNPYSNTFTNIKTFHGGTPFANKFWECQFYKSSDIVNLSFRISHRQSHAGLDFGIGLFGYCFEFNFYDRRHWNHTLNCWENE